MLHKSIRLKSLICLVISFTLISNTVFAGRDLDRALSSEIKPVINDDNRNHIDKAIYLEDDIAFLKQLSHKELQPLVELLKNRWANQLPPEVFYSPKIYLSEIIDELEKYAGNTFMNVLRGGKGISYREMLEDVCKEQGIKVNKYISTATLGNLLLEKSLTNAVNNMTEKEKNEIINNCEFSIGEEMLDSTTAKKVAFGAIFSTAYKKSEYFKWLIKLLPKVIREYFVGTLGTVLIACFCINSDIAGPAKRITVPAVTYIEYMRLIKEG